MSAKKYSILISYLIGAPIGLVTVLFFFILPAMITNEGLVSMAIIGIYGKGIIGLAFSFLIALGFAGKNAFQNISNNNSLLLASFKYSFTVNVIIWFVFMSITFFTNQESSFLYLVPPFIAFIISVVVTTFTIGLFICYLIQRKIMH